MCSTYKCIRKLESMMKAILYNYFLSVFIFQKLMQVYLPVDTLLLLLVLTQAFPQENTSVAYLPCLGAGFEAVVLFRGRRLGRLGQNA